jgi:UDP-3-O-[3-hydroxymyristoyl] glucosamine N-acyltransferase
MLINLNSNKPVYVIGKCATATGIVNFLESECQVENISVEEYHTLPAGSQCMLGFFTMPYRVKFFNETNVDQHTWPSYIHPNATVISPSMIERGCIIWPCAFVGHTVTVSEFSMVSQMSSLGKDVVLGRNCMITPGTIIGGSTTVGKNVYFGQTSSIKDKINICNNVTFLMNSTVSKDISISGKYYGNRKL